MLWDMENLGGRDFQNLEIKRFGDGVFFRKGILDGIGWRHFGDSFL